MTGDGVADPAVPGPPPAVGADPGAASSVVLGDGVRVDIRPLAAADLEALVAFHEHLSAETVYRRFFGFHPHLSPAEAEHFCTLDYCDRFALGVFDGPTLVAVARLERIEPPTTGEVAFVVADSFQHRGLGQLLAVRLLAVAAALGITEAVAETLADNYPMIHLLPDAGFEVTMSASQGVTRIVCPLPQPVPAAPD